MAEENKAPEMGENQGENKPAEQHAETPAVDTVSISKAEFEKIQKALKDANTEAAKHRKRLEAYEQQEQAAKDAQLTEMEKLQKKLAAIEQEKAQLAADLAKRDLLARKVTIAKKIGLPDALATRLIGETDEDIETDAKALLETLPKPPAPPLPPKAQPGIVPANPGVNGSTQETDAQKRARLFGAPADIFDPEIARKLGGGAFINREE